MMRRLCIAFILVAFGLGAPWLRGQGAVVRKPVAEILEAFGKKSGGQGARELEELGGEVAVKEILEKAVAEGGEVMGERTVRAVRQHGPSLLGAMKAEPAAMLNAISKLPDDVATRAIAEASRAPVVMGRLVKTYGDEALEVSARHPGVGIQVVEKYGAAGVKAGKELTTDEMIQLARARGYEALSSVEKDLFAKAFDRNPRQVFNALLAAGGGTALVITAVTVNDVAHQLLGTPEKPGALVSAVNSVVWLVAIAIALWLGIKVWAVWRRARTDVPPIGE